MSKNPPVSFIGISDHISSEGHPFPYGSINLYRLSQYKGHIFYPALTQDCLWVFGVSADGYDDLERVNIRVEDDQGQSVGSLNFPQFTEIPSGATLEDIFPKNSSKEDQEGYQSRIFIRKEQAGSTVIAVKFKTNVSKPGICTITCDLDGKKTKIGEVNFLYNQAPPLTPDLILALQADPNVAKTVRGQFGCRECPTKLNVYTTINPKEKLEKQGFIHQSNLDNEFQCECGKTKCNLKYVKESFHGLLQKRLDPKIMDLSFERQYAHNNILEIANKFRLLLDENGVEEKYQKFIEKNLVLLARFHSTRVFIKPKILGKYFCDFAILDTSKNLLLVEIERPSLKLFKAKGHLTDDFNHAYEQVTDWMQEVAKHRAAVLDVLNLESNQVAAIKGVVIAGRSINENFNFLQRHLSQPRPNVDFLTYDELVMSMIEISRTLA